MSEVELTVAQVAKQTGETVHVIRNWLKDFRQYIPVERGTNGYNRFTQESINVIKRIQKMAREQKLTTRQIEAILSGAEKPIVTDEDATEAVAGDLAEIKELLKMQQEFNAALIQRLDEQQRIIEKHVKQRDEQVTAVLLELRETKRLQAAAREPWWKSMFKPK